MKKHKRIVHVSTPRVSSPEITGLRESIEKIKLEKELKRLREEGHEKESSEDKEERKVKSEVEDLNKKREEYSKTKGFKGLIGKLSLNAQINQKKNYINNIQKIRNANQLLKLKEAQAKATAKEKELRESRKSLNDIDIFGVNRETKKLNFDELFKT